MKEIELTDEEVKPLTREEGYKTGSFIWIDAQIVSHEDGTDRVTLWTSDGDVKTSGPDWRSGTSKGGWYDIYEGVMKAKKVRKEKRIKGLRLADGNVQPFTNWDLARMAIRGGGAHILLYGRQPGTGKTSWPIIVAKEMGLPVFSCNATEEATAAEPRGHFIHAGNEGYKFILGQACLAMTTPGLFLVNEIDHSSPDLMSFWHAVFDDPERAMVPLPDGRGTIITPKPGYRAVATMNGDITDLPQPIRDRFAIQLHIPTANPAALEAMDEDLRPLMVMTKSDPREVGEKYSLRQKFAFQRTRQTMGETAAGMAVFGAQWAEILNAIEIARAAKGAKKKAA